MGSAGTGIAVSTPSPPAGPIATVRPSRPLLWLLTASGAFVFFEPSIYEFAFLLLCWALIVERLSIPTLLVAPLLLLVVLFNIGGLTSLIQASHDMDAVRFTAISVYLTLTTLVIAAVVAADPVGRGHIIRSAWIVAGVITATAGILGYFSGSELLTLHGRARGLFKDPNVYGPFLVFPALLLMQDMLALSGRKLVRAAVPLGIITIGILLSFSRAAWAHFLLSAALMAYLMLVTSPSPLLRLRLVIGSLVAMAALGGLVVALLAVPQVRDTVEMRAGAQEYDVGVTGRFGNQIRSIPELLDRPLGYGPLQFADHYGEAPHNVYLNAFSAYGWLGGVSYMAFVILTLWMGIRFAFVDVPWRNLHLAALATFAGVSMVGFVVDTDHWRHFFFLAGLIWGCAAAALALRGRSGDRQRMTG
jgi:hypothetical protein